MARTSNSKLAKSNDKNRVARSASSENEAAPSKKTAKANALGEVSTKAKVKTAPSVEAKAAPAKENTAEDKKVSQKLLETLERRRKNQQAQNPRSMQLFAKPGGRRGRRPKASAEYTPGNQEEETYALESDYEGLEYDTGIRVKEAAEDRSFNLDRFDDYDEELNFDW